LVPALRLPVSSAQTVEPAPLLLGGYCAQIAPGMPLFPVAVTPKPRIGYLSTDRLASDVADRFCTWHWLRSGEPTVCWRLTTASSGSASSH
jgi:hypothetical protein